MTRLTHGSMPFATLVAALALQGCGQQADTAPAEAPSIPPAQAPAARLPAVEPPLGREALLHAVLRAGSAYTLGQDDRAAHAKLDGRPFSVRIRFGCPGDQGAGEGAADAGARGWRFDEGRRVLRVRAKADIAGVGEGYLSEQAGEVEAVEGFWFSHPWLVEAACLPEPSTEGEAVASPPAEQPAPRLIGLAQFYSKTDVRTHRRYTRGYEATTVLPEGAEPSVQGYDLWLTGRLKRQADGRVILCRAERPDVQPSCIVSVEFDRVAITPGGSDEALASWSAG